MRAYTFLIIYITCLVVSAEKNLRHKYKNILDQKNGRNGGDNGRPKRKGKKGNGKGKKHLKQLKNVNFLEGTYRIKKSGTYVLKEDISFCPNTVEKFPNDVLTCCKPRPDQFVSRGGDYPDFPFAMGFFAAITIETDNVVIDLNGFTIEQCKEHALMQRFFSVFELANSPFIPGQGPRDFGTSFVAGKNIVIHNGKIGRSAHHGIHGNGNVGVKIENVTFKDFEVAAVALNGVKNLKVEKCTAINRKDVPTMGIFSSAFFINQYVKAFESNQSPTTLKVKGQTKTVVDISTDLTKSIENVYEDVIINDGFINKNKHPDEYALFHNKEKVPSGNSYGFLTNPIGVAIGGFPYSNSSQLSKNVIFKDVQVLKQVAAVYEVPTLWNGTVGKPVTDAAGAVFQLRNAEDSTPLTISTLQDDTKAKYIGNVVANAQVFVAKAILNGEIPKHLPIGRNMISKSIIDWVEGANNGSFHLSDLLHLLDPGKTGYVCNGDAMFHVNKGVIGFKIDGTTNIKMEHCVVYDARNRGLAGSNVCGENYKAPGANQKGYGGTNVRGFSFAGSKDAEIYQSYATKLTSHAGNAIGFDIHTDSTNIHLDQCHEHGLKALGGSSQSSLCDDDAYGLLLGEETKENKIDAHCFTDPMSIVGASIQIKDKGNRNTVQENMCE